MKAKGNNRPSIWKKMTLMAIGLGALYWILASTVDVFVFHEGNLIEEIFTLDSHKIWMRSLVLCTLIMFSIYALSVIYERKKAEEALRESEGRFRQFASTVTDVICRYDPKNKRFDFLSPSFELQTGYSLEDMKADPAGITQRMTHPDDIERVSNEVETHIKKGSGAGPFSTEYRVVRNDGQTIWVSDRKDIEFTPEGKVYRINSVIRDITERKQMEDALRESEENHRSLIENSLQGLAVVQGFQIAFANNASAEITGYTTDELISLRSDEVKSLVHLDDQDLVWKRFQDRLAGKPVSPRYEYRLIRKDGGIRRVEMFASRIDYRGKPAVQAALVDITERKRAEEELRESEEKFSNLFHHSNDAIFLHDSKGNIMDANQKVSDLFGYTKDEIVSLKISDLHPPETSEKCRWAFEKISQDGFVSLEVDFKKRNGEVFPAEVSASLFEIGGKEVIQGIVRDITERKKAEEAVRVSEERLRQIAENVGEGFFLSDASDNSAIYVSPAYEKIWGRPVEKVYVDAQSWLEVVHPEDRERVNACVEKHGRGRIEFSQEYRIQWPDGSTRWVRDRVYPVKNESGEIHRIVGVTDDITERKKMEEALRETNARLQTLIQAIPDVVYVKNVQGRNLLVNKAYEELVNLQQTQIVGKTDEEVLPPDLTCQCHLSDDEVMFKHEPVRCEEHFTRENGLKIYFETIKAPLYDDAGKPLGLVGVSRDITERKRTEENLKNAKKEAEEANRLKSEFLANMSHEIRTPMNAIIGMTDITLDTDLSDEQRDYLKTVKHSARALLELLNDILDLSKIEVNKTELEFIDFDLRVTVEDVADTLASKASAKGLELTCMIHSQVPSLLRGDPGRLRQILMNLLGNAIKFTQKGEVAMGVDLEEETEDRVTLLFSVTDTGIGISPDKQTRIFESFIQADGSTTRKYGGTGLGLSICKRLVDLMGGQIRVESKPEKGSRFYFSLTLEKQEEPEDNPLPIPPDIHGMRILVVDDNKTNRTILVKMTESFGCSPEAVESGNDAILLLKKAVHKEKLFDLVLLDMQMPKMNGEETLRAIKDDPEIKGVPVVILTSMGLRGDVARLETLSCAGYLLKPIKQSELFEAIITVLGRHQFGMKEKPVPIVTRHTIAEQKRRGIRILLAEDHPMNQKLAVTLLKRAGYPVDAVENGRLVIEALNRKDYDLILMDVQMPEMDGFETTKLIRNRPDDRKNTPIIAMTAHAMKGDREKCLQAGMDDYVSKPIDPHELLNAIEKWTKSSDWSEAVVGREKARMEELQQDITIDLETALDRFDGDREFFKEMLREFLNSSPGQLQTIEEGIKRGDTRLVEREAHSIKGAAGNLCAKSIAHLCLKLELMARAADLTDAMELINDLKAKFKNLEKYLYQTLEQEGVLKS